MATTQNDEHIDFDSFDFSLELWREPDGGVSLTAYNKHSDSGHGRLTETEAAELLLWLAKALKVEI